MKATTIILITEHINVRYMSSYSWVRRFVQIRKHFMLTCSIIICFTMQILFYPNIKCCLSSSLSFLQKLAYVGMPNVVTKIKYGYIYQYSVSCPKWVRILNPGKRRSYGCCQYLFTKVDCQKLPKKYASIYCWSIVSILNFIESLSHVRKSNYFHIIMFSWLALKHIQVNLTW